MMARSSMILRLPAYATLMLAIVLVEHISNAVDQPAVVLIQRTASPRTEIIQLTAAPRTEISQKLNSSETLGKCLEPGKIVFLHLMKNGGSSVDVYLKKLCRQSAKTRIDECTILHSEGTHIDNKVTTFEHGHCNPSVCATHGTMHNMVKDCGPQFLGARTFTILREPLDRAYSFYRYAKEHAFGGMEDVQKALRQNSFEQTLGLCDANDGDLLGKRQNFPCKQFMNVMVMFTFSATQWSGPCPRNNESVVAVHGWNEDKKEAGMCFRDADILEQYTAAKEQLGRVTKIFLFKDLNKFPLMLEASGIWKRAYRGSAVLDKDGSGVEFLKGNPSKLGKPLTGKDSRAFKKLNNADLKLYTWAENAGYIFRSSKVPEVPLDEFAVFQEFETAQEIAKREKEEDEELQREEMDEDAAFGW